MLDFDLFQVQLSWELSFFSAKAVRIAGFPAKGSASSGNMTCPYVYMYIS